MYANQLNWNVPFAGNLPWGNQSFPNPTLYAQPMMREVPFVGLSVFRGAMGFYPNAQAGLPVQMPVVQHLEVPPIDPVTQPYTHGSVQYAPNTVPPSTAQRIVQLAVSSLRDPIVFHTAREIVSHLIEENVSPFLAHISEIQAIYHLIAQKMRYTRDPIGIELVYGPSEIVSQWKKLGRWSEDCDGYATVLMAFFMAIGRSCRTTIVSFNEHNPDMFEHVFVEVLVPGDYKQRIPERWVTVDPSTAPHTDAMLQNIKHARFFYP